MNKKIIFSLAIGLVIICGILVFIYHNDNLCSNQGTIFLKANESSMAGGLAKQTGSLVAIPELNEVIGNTAQLSCPNFINPLNYLKHN